MRSTRTPSSARPGRDALNVGVQGGPCGGKIVLRRDAEDDAAGFAFVRQLRRLRFEHYGKADVALAIAMASSRFSCEPAGRNGNSKLLQDLLGAIFRENSGIKTILFFGLDAMGRAAGARDGAARGDASERANGAFRRGETGHSEMTQLGDLRCVEGRAFIERGEEDRLRGL